MILYPRLPKPKTAPPPALPPEPSPGPTNVPPGETTPGSGTRRRSLKELCALALAIIALTLAACSIAVHAQDPRAARRLQQLADRNEFCHCGLRLRKGEQVLVDPSLPLDNVSNESHVGVFAYATTLNVLGKSAKFDMIIPGTFRSPPRGSFLVEKAARALCQRIRRPGVPFLHELHRRSGADGGGV